MTILSMDFSEKKPRKSRGEGNGRREHDAYMTPMSLVESIVERIAQYVRPDSLASATPLRILEPSCGTGEFVSAAHRRWPNATVVGVDIRPEVADHFKVYASNVKFVCADFLKLDPATFAVVDLFLGNLPYAQITEFLGRMLDGAKEGATLAFLCRFGHLVGGVPSREWWLTPRRHAVDAVGPSMTPNRQIVDTLPIFPRPSFTGGGTDATEYALIVMRKGFDNGGRFDPIRWEKPVTKRGRKSKASAINGASDAAVEKDLNDVVPVEPPSGGDLFGGES